MNGGWYGGSTVEPLAYRQLGISSRKNKHKRMTVRDFCKKICQKKSLSDRKKAGIFVSIVLLQH